MTNKDGGISNVQLVTLTVANANLSTHELASSSKCEKRIEANNPDFTVFRYKYMTCVLVLRIRAVLSALDFCPTKKSVWSLGKYKMHNRGHICHLFCSFIL